MGKKWKFPTAGIKRKAVDLVKQGLNKGNSVTKSRKVAARATGYTAETIYNWEKQLTGRSLALRGKRITKKTTKSNDFLDSISIKSTTGRIINLTKSDVQNIAKLADFMQ